MGCQASHFGDRAYVLHQLGHAWMEQQTTGKLNKVPEVRTTITRADEATGEDYEVIAWLKEADASGGPGFEFCLQDVGTHVLTRSLRTGSQEAKEVVVPLNDIQVTGRKHNSYWYVLMQALGLANQKARLGAVKLQVID